MKTSMQCLVGLAPRRKAAGYTQETFAEALGVTRSLLAAWEVGRVWPSARWLPHMAELLNCPIEALFIAPTDTTILSQEGGEHHAEAGHGSSIIEDRTRGPAVPLCAGHEGGVT